MDTSQLRLQPLHQWVKQSSENNPTLISLLLIFLVSSAQATQYPLKSLASLGVQTKVFKSGTSTIQEFYDSNAKKTLRYQYNSKDILESIEELDGFGVLVEKTRFLPNRLWKQTSTELNEWITNRSGRSIHRITDLTGKRKTIQLFYEPSLDQEFCEKPFEGDLNKIMDQVKDLQPLVSDNLGKAKVSTKDCGGYVGGEKQLLKEMQEAVNTGAECLAGKSPESKLEATKLLAYFENSKTTLNLFCAETDKEVKIGENSKESVSSGTLARALVPPEEKSPGMIINVSNLKETTPLERKSTLFHEMLHWLGILHSESFDTPYLADSCCFSEDKTTEKTKKACGLLEKTPRPKIDTKDYMNEFTDVMLLDYRSFIPMRMIRKSTAKKITKPPVDLSAEFEANQKIRTYGNSVSDVHAQVLKRLDSKLKEPEDYKKDETKYGQAAEMTGDLVALMHQKSTYEDFEKSAAQVKVKYKELLAGAKDEAEKAELKEKIHDWISEYSLLSFDVPSPTDSNKVWPYKMWEELEKDL